MYIQVHCTVYVHTGTCTVLYMYIQVHCTVYVHVRNIVKPVYTCSDHLLAELICIVSCFLILSLHNYTFAIIIIIVVTYRLLLLLWLHVHVHVG